jgi:hypothetical protein
MLKTIILLLSIFQQENPPQGNPNKPKPCPQGLWDKETNNWKCDDPLPVTVKSFKGHTKIDYIQLRWEVTNVVNHSYYEVYRSYDGSKYECIGRTSEKYFDDKTVMQSAYYYLVDVSEDGVRTKHSIIYAFFKLHIYVVHTIEGRLLGIVRDFSSLPRNQYLIINNTKVIIHDKKNN